MSFDKATICAIVGEGHPHSGRAASACRCRWARVALLHGAMGLRFGEAAGLRWSDIHLDEAELSINRTLTDAAGRLSFGPPKTLAGTRTRRR